ncbi:oxaloacetate-decarboxylating malate dehydrogenase [Terrilactibacillus sp. BCM23-1]|uniref:Oxaloacetate-decarboxylating malate dehydrogenase n=1 Tax=Terrilactibacillus tamarindi TaxID=2599694 RepID=A0A6N8CQD1_9BACI|nr:NAD-dependent malic enzyme [Terrilactibacillus tamarindi]MTT31145.1 oxaloacetate-decarboxylating malate dehydrogenase [Terrilactibacillus tamarindi]
MEGKYLLSDPLYNKGTGFTREERVKYKLQGLLPPVIQTIEEQAEQIYHQIQQKADNMEKHLFLMQLYDTNRTLFYYVMSKHISDLLPIIYTPTIGDAVMQYHETYTTPKDAVFLSINQSSDMHQALLNAVSEPNNIDIIIVTDGEGVLGIGDWGVNGVNISVGKLAVYTAASGIDPSHILPVVLDVGTNNDALLKDPYYLGNRHKRIEGEPYDAFIDQFVHEIQEVFPKALLHWEDFGRSNAARILEKYNDRICTFNDDIQGTGIMMVAAALATIKVSHIPLQDQRILIFGAGTAGIGIAEQLVEEIVRSTDLSEAEAIKQFYLVDRHGVVLDNMKGLTAGQIKFAQSYVNFERKNVRDLYRIVKEVKPTMLIGASGVSGAFTEEVVKEMAKHTERPAIFPISNPTRLAEAKANDLIKWTNGKALVVTGSPSAPVEYNGVSYKIGQANNALLYPGLGFGIAIAKATRVTANMLSAAAHAVADVIDVSNPGAPMLPSVARLNETSKLVAKAVVKECLREGNHQVEIDDIDLAINQAIWTPEYTS